MGIAELTEHNKYCLTLRHEIITEFPSTTLAIQLGPMIARKCRIRKAMITLGADKEKDHPRFLSF